MNKEILKGKWNQLKGEVQKNWGDFTDDEVDQINGKTSKLLGLLQEKYGLKQEEAEKEVEKFIDTHIS